MPESKGGRNMSDTSSLHEEVPMGDLTLKNRVLMAPLTRNRANADGTPKDLAIEYYRQRASAGLIVTEATQISEMGKGYIDTPGIHNDKHVEAWKHVTDAVHEAGGLIFCQLWHVGRISHTSLLPDGAQPVSSSAIRANAQTFTQNGFEDCSEPVALDKDGIQKTLEDYAHAAKCAQQSGFDGIEVHAANGYLIDQFLRDNVNNREDEYGGSVQNRTRFLSETIEAVTSQWNSKRVGVRLSPLGQFNDMNDSAAANLFGEVYDTLTVRELAYLHVVERFSKDGLSEQEKTLMKELRNKFSGFYIANGAYDAQDGSDAISSGHADAIAYGQLFLANPDLPERFRRNSPLNEPDQSTFYGGNEKGYTDYPFLDETT